MADPKRLDREELLKARARVQRQLEIFAVPVGAPAAGFMNKNRRDLVAKLKSILEGIEEELKESDT